MVRYLAGRRIITLPPPPSLRYAPALRRPDGSRGPAMIARIDSADGELIGVHRTWLFRDEHGTWCRESRAMLGRAAGGAARLAEPETTLLVGEGIETCLAAMEVTGTPAWAALSTSGLIALALPASVRNVVILADPTPTEPVSARPARLRRAGWRGAPRPHRDAAGPGTDMCGFACRRPRSITRAIDAAA